MRLAKAEEEINRAPEFDVVVVNDDLDLAIEQVATQIKQFLN
jgi:guanylate kinase